MVLSSDKIQIDDYINNKGEKAIHSTRGLLINGIVKILPVYEMSLSFLKLNIFNGRFASEKRQKERELGHELDPLNPQHEVVLINLLLPPEDSKSKDLIDDLRKLGQIDPGIITEDGILIDGNRRYAALKKLNTEDPSGKYSNMLVHRILNLPPKEIYKLEIVTQIRDPLKVKYHPINDLLKIREGLKFYNENELARILGWKVRKVKSYKDRLGLIEDFLQSIKAEGCYYLLVNYSEHFAEFQKALNKAKKRLSPTELDELFDVFNYAMKINIENNNRSREENMRLTQRDHIRFIGDAYCDEKIRKRLIGNLNSSDLDKDKKVYEDIKAATQIAKETAKKINPLVMLKRANDYLDQIPILDNLNTTEAFKDELKILEMHYIRLKEALEENEVGN